MIEQRDSDKRYIKNWGPIWRYKDSLKIFCILIPPNQTGYADGRVISDSGRLTLYILKVADLVEEKEI